MPSHPTEDPPYLETLDQLRAALPRLADLLSASERTRSARTALMLSGARFAGLDELLSKLDVILAAWRDDPRLARIAFLVHRAIGDFETAIEAGLSGYPTVAADAMRDVMEIELLLLDFFVDADQIDAWLFAPRSTRLRDFSPAALRRRLIGLGLHDVVGTGDIELDYRAHSEALHVTPVQMLLPFLTKGHAAADDLFTLDSSFVEIFEHGRRLGNALLLIASEVSPDSPAAEACKGPLPAFELAHERTQEFFRQFLDMVRESFASVAESESPAAGEGDFEAPPDD